MKTLPIIQQKFKIKEIQPILIEAISKLFKTSYYDRSVYYLETNLNPLKIQDPTKYNFDSLAIANKYGTADCVGIAKKIQKELKHLFKLQLIPASTPIARYQTNMPKCTHPGLIIWCQDGYILIDPAMNIATTIIFQENSKVELDLGLRGKWEYILDLENKKIEVFKNSTNPHKPWSEKVQLENKFEYYLEEVIDPDLSMAIPHFIFDRKVLICPFNDPKQESYCFMTLDLNLSLIEYCNLTYNNGVEKTLVVPFQEYYNNSKILNKLISKEIVNNLKIPKVDLIYRTETVINRVKDNHKLK